MNTTYEKSDWKLSDFECQDYMYYVGHLVDTDSSGWVSEQELESIIKDLNSQTELKKLAQELYFDSVKVEDWRKDFIDKLETHEVVDKRPEGYYCTYDKKFSDKPVAFQQDNKVIFPSHALNQIWIVNKHYDGCRGWD
jgi:hypothetical protein